MHRTLPRRIIVPACRQADRAARLAGGITALTGAALLTVVINA